LGRNSASDPKYLVKDTYRAPIVLESPKTTVV
jgi:hypothetical protein